MQHMRWMRPSMMAALMVSALLPLARAQSAPDAATWAPAPLAWLPFENAVQAAAQQNKQVLVDIYAPWCGWCRRMHEEIYTDPAVKSHLNQHFILTRLNTSEYEQNVSYREYDLTEAELAAGFGAEGTPTTVFLAADGTYVTRLGGYPKNLMTATDPPRSAAAEFLHVLQYISSGAYQTQDFQEYAQGLGDDR